MEILSASHIEKSLSGIYTHAVITTTMFLVVLFSCPLLEAAIPSWQDFRKDPDLLDHAVSPDGRYLAVLARDGQDTRVTIHDLDAKGYPIIGVMEGSVRRPVGVDWASKDRLLVNVHVPHGTKTLLKKKGKGEELDMHGIRGVYRTLSTDVQAKDLVVLLEEKAHRARIHNLSGIQHYLPDDPEHILMRVFSGKTISLHKVNIYNGDSEHLIKGGRHTVSFLTDASGILKFRYDVLPRSQVINIYKLLSNSKWGRVVSIKLDEDDESALDHDGLVSINQDGELLYRALNKSTGFLEIKKLSAQGAPETYLSLEGQDVLGLMYNDKGEVAGYMTEADILRHHYFDPASQAMYDEIVKQALGEGVVMHVNNTRHHAVYSYGRDNLHHKVGPEVCS